MDQRSYMKVRASGRCGAIRMALVFAGRAGYVDSVECECIITSASLAPRQSCRTFSYRPGGDVVSGLEICACCTIIHRGREDGGGGGGAVQGRVGNPASAEVAPKQKGPSTGALSSSPLTRKHVPVKRHQRCRKQYSEENRCLALLKVKWM